jgi:hypothetical protein
MLYELSIKCRHCANEIETILHDDEIIDNCPHCKSVPFSVRKITGLIYIVSNPNQRGVKIGLTEKTLENRLKSLNSTGVAGKFVGIAIFPSDRPAFDEKRVHEKVKRYKIEKEHFDLDPIDAVLNAYRALNRRRPIFIDKSIEEIFALRLEQDRISMKLRLSGSGNS